MIYLIGINSFIGHHLYLKLRKLNYQICCLHHDNLKQLNNCANDDIVINFCGVNRAKTRDEYVTGNEIVVKDVCQSLFTRNVTPYLIHISSLMVNGFQNKQLSDLPDYQKYFIESKLNAEKYLETHYNLGKLCILRPSNIYGYDCEPYANNLLVTLVYEKIMKKYTITKINKNCIRNFLSVNGLCNQLLKIIQQHKTGNYDVISNNHLDLQSLCHFLYKDSIPTDVQIIDSEVSHPNFRTDENAIIIDESIEQNIALLEDNMNKFLRVKNLVEIKQLTKLSQPRGDMIEVSNLASQRLYIITLNDHSIRGNHYHFKQIEHFYVNKGQMIFLLSHKDSPEIIYFKVVKKETLMIINPLMIHTVINDFIQKNCEIVIGSTQPYTPGQVLDTEYINLL